MDPNVMYVILIRLVLLCYFAALFLAFLNVVKHRVSNRPVIMLSAGGLFIHLCAILARFIARPQRSLTTVHEILFILAALIMLAFLIASVGFKIRAVNLFILPVVVVLTLATNLLPSAVVPLSESLQGNWFLIHATLSLAGLAALFLHFVSVLMYLLQQRSLKKKTLGRLFHYLPSIGACDRLGYNALLVGFPLLTLAIITGSIWAVNVRGSFIHFRPWEIVILVTWALFALILEARLSSGWRGRRAAYLSITGFVLVVIAFFGILLSPS